MVRAIEPPALSKYLGERFNAEIINADDGAAKLYDEIGNAFGEDFAEICRQTRSVLDTINQAFNEATDARDAEDFELHVTGYITNALLRGAVLDFYMSQDMKPLRYDDYGCVFSREDKQTLVSWTPMDERGKSGFFVTVTEM